MCVGNSTTFDAGWGKCHTYAPSIGNFSSNFHYCDQDYDGTYFARQVCQECGKCEGSSKGDNPGTCMGYNPMCGGSVCVAVKNDGTAEAWGESSFGGDTSGVDLTNVKSAMCGIYACVALKNDGTAEAWGRSEWGGDASRVDLTNVQSAMCGESACVAVKNDGTAEAWGYPEYGGDASGVDLTNVKSAMCDIACVAVKNDGTA